MCASRGTGEQRLLRVEIALLASSVVPVLGSVALFLGIRHPIAGLILRLSLVSCLHLPAVELLHSLLGFL